MNKHDAGVDLIRRKRKGKTRRIRSVKGVSVEEWSVCWKNDEAGIVAVEKGVAVNKYANEIVSFVEEKRRTKG